MRPIRALSVLLLSVPILTLSAQTPAVIPMASEPHHHLALHNQYVNVYEVEVQPNDSVLLHRHDHDVLAITIGNPQVTVGIPGQPDKPQKLTDGQLRLQPRGYVHSTHIDGTAVYRAVAVEFALPEQNGRNLCATVIAGLPLDCPAVPSTAANGYVNEPQYQSDQTLVMLVRVLPHQQAPIAARRGLIVALDDATLVSADGSSKAEHASSFEWLEAGGPVHIFKNDSDQEARFLLFDLKSPDVAQTNPPASK